MMFNDTIDYVTDALARPSAISAERDGSVSVSTFCLYPSNALVNVFVSGGPNGAIVSDKGHAIDELTALNREVPDADRYLRRFCRNRGLFARRGIIFSPTIERHQLWAAIAFVANASAAAAAWGVEKLKIRQRRDVRGELKFLLDEIFPKGRLNRKSVIEGHSTRNYRFDTVIQLDSDHTLIVDPVISDANSINSRAVAHLDVGRREDERFVQRLVYDEQRIGMQPIWRFFKRPPRLFRYRTRIGR